MIRIKINNIIVDVVLWLIIFKETFFIKFLVIFTILKVQADRIYVLTIFIVPTIN